MGFGKEQLKVTGITNSKKMPLRRGAFLDEGGDLL
jgi:hypothetical protein